MGHTVLLIDDDSEWLVFLGRLLDSAGFHVVPLVDSNKLEQVLDRQTTPDLVVTDLLMPGATASVVYQQVREKLGDNVPVIICSGTKMRVKVEENLLSHVNKSDASSDLVREAHRLLAARARNSTDIADDPDLDLPATKPRGAS